MKTETVNSEKRTRLVVLVSGNGSNLQALIDAIKADTLQAEICAVISNKPDAYGLERAKLAGIPALVAPKSAAPDRAAYDSELARLTASFQPDLIVLAGWMRLLTMNFLGSFPGKIINLHPALPGTFPGTNAIERAYEAFQQGAITHTGVMVHFVPDEGVDSGPVILQEQVEIKAEDTLELLEARIHACEHRLLVEAIRQLTQTKSEVDHVE